MVRVRACTLSLLVAAMPALAGVAPAQAAVIVGTADTQACLFDCLVDDAGSVYTLTFNAAAFTGPLVISEFSYQLSSAGTLANAGYTLSFYLKPANGSADVLLSTFGHFSLGGMAPSRLSFTGTPTTYDPALGNLVLQVSSDSFAGGADTAQFEADDTGQDLTGTNNGAFAGNGTATTGLVTSFDDAAAPTAIPEPAGVTLLAVGAVATSLLTRRRRTRGAIRP